MRCCLFKCMHQRVLPFVQSANHAGMKLELAVDGSNMDDNDSKSRTSQSAKAHTKSADDAVTCAAATCPLLGTMLIYEQLESSPTGLTKERLPVVLMGSTQTQAHVFVEHND